MTGKLKIIGDNPWDQVIGRPLPALAYRPGDRELAIATPQGLRILAPAEGYRQLAAVPELDAVSLAYTTDGSRLLAGTANGLVVLDAAAGYAEHTTDGKGTVSRVVVDPTGRWLALVGRRQVSIRRAPDLVEVKTLTTTAVTDADFAPDGSGLAVAEADGQVRLFRAPRWHELSPIAAKRPRAVAFRPGGGTRIPVLFVHGHLRDSGSTWFESSRRTYSVVDALAVNPQLPIDAFFLELPTHVKAVPNRSISDDALDVLAAIEGGADSQGRLQVGILNLSAYQEAGKVAIVASSQGAVSSRYYIKDHMGTRHGGPVTVSEFVLLAAPNHGIGAGLTRIMCGRLDEPDRARRQLCGGRTKADQDDCGQCSPMPPEFTTNQHGDSDFFTELNGRPLSATCSGTNDPREAPHSRGNTNPEGVLYVNLYAGSPPDTVVGGDTQSRDCVGRRLARLLAADVANRVVNDVPLPIHGNFPHHWRTICLALRTVEKHDAPSDNPAEQLRACQSLVRPPSG